ncbi:unnamed protein product [Symbiodinium sp. CCMP2456]|nr:unnamed protein product [Symbiodinium sp. CCMP2456]
MALGFFQQSGCAYRFARASTPSVVEVTPLEGATLEHEAPLVRIVVAGWDGAHGSDLAQVRTLTWKDSRLLWISVALPDLDLQLLKLVMCGSGEVFFGSQECEVNFTKRLVQPCAALKSSSAAGSVSPACCSVTAALQARTAVQATVPTPQMLSARAEFKGARKVCRVCSVAEGRQQLLDLNRHEVSNVLNADMAEAARDPVRLQRQAVAASSHDESGTALAG